METPYAKIEIANIMVKLAIINTPTFKQAIIF